MPHTPEIPESFVRLLYYLAGIASTVVGAWITNKIRIYHDNRGRHHEELKEKILTSLRGALHNQYGPLIGRPSQVVSVVWGRWEVRDDAAVQETPETWGPQLQSQDPRWGVEGNLDEAFLEDAGRHHYRDLIQAWQAFRDSWTAFIQEGEAWVTRIGAQVLERSGLPAFPAGRDDPYLMHLRLGTFVYRRLFQAEPAALRREIQGQSCLLHDDQATVAKGSEVQIEQLLGILNGVVEAERPTALQLLRERDRIQAELLALSRQLSLAIAERKLRGSCSLVTFF